MAIEMSLGNKLRNTKAWMRVVTRRPNTVIVATADRKMARERVTQFVIASFEYLIVAMAAPVIGNVYAHHVNENLMPRKKLIRVANEK